MPLTPGYEPSLVTLVQDEDVRRYTRVPTEPTADFVATWLGRYEEGWRDGTRAGFAIEAHDGEFLGLGLFVRIEREARQGEMAHGCGAHREGERIRRLSSRSRERVCSADIDASRSNVSRDAPPGRDPSGR